MSKKDRAKGGYAIFEAEEIQEIYKPEYLETSKQKDPDFYYCILVALVSGARASEITSLEPNQLKDLPPRMVVRDSKTVVALEKYHCHKLYMMNSKHSQLVKPRCLNIYS